MATTPHFKLSARPTRGGYRGVASLGDGVVALKTVPVFREEKDALDAIRAWVAKHGAHADRHMSRGRFTRSTRHGNAGRRRETLVHAVEYHDRQGVLHIMGPFRTEKELDSALLRAMRVDPDAHYFQTTPTRFLLRTAEIQRNNERSRFASRRRAPRRERKTKARR